MIDTTMFKALDAGSGAFPAGKIAYKKLEERTRHKVYYFIIRAMGPKNGNWSIGQAFANYYEHLQGGEREMVARDLAEYMGIRIFDPAVIDLAHRYGMIKRLKAFKILISEVENSGRMDVLSDLRRRLQGYIKSDLNGDIIRNVEKSIKEAEFQLMKLKWHQE